MVELFRNSLWPGLAAWVALYISDYSLTLVCARLYQAGVREKIVFEGSYELTPYYQKDIDSLRRVSPRFLAILLMSSVWLSALWWLAMQIPSPNLYFFSLGMLILLQLAVHMRHLRNLFLFRAIMRNGGVRGRIEYPRALTLRMSSFELFNFAALFAILFLVSRSWFVLGGAVSCLSVSLKHWRLARKHVPTLPADQQAVAAAAAGDATKGSAKEQLHDPTKRA